MNSDLIWRPRNTLSHFKGAAQEGGAQSHELYFTNIDGCVDSGSVVRVYLQLAQFFSLRK